MAGYKDFCGRVESDPEALIRSRLRGARIPPGAYNCGSCGVDYEQACKPDCVHASPLAALDDLLASVRQEERERCARAADANSGCACGEGAALAAAIRAHKPATGGSAHE